jgi:hypothetical protein
MFTTEWILVVFRQKKKVLGNKDSCDYSKVRLSLTLFIVQRLKKMSTDIPTFLFSILSAFACHS